MKTTKKRLAGEKTGSTFNVKQRNPGKLLSRRITSTCLALTLATTPFSWAWADAGYMVMQFQFELSSKPIFRQLNMAYQEGVARSQWAYYGESGKPGILVSLYSMNPREPGLFNELLFNRLEKPESEEEEGKPGGIRAVLSAILGAGIIAAYAYASGKCVEDIGNAVQDSAACDAVSSGW